MSNQSWPTNDSHTSVGTWRLSFSGKIIKTYRISSVATNTGGWPLYLEFPQAVQTQNESPTWRFLGYGRFFWQSTLFRALPANRFVCLSAMCSRLALRILYPNPHPQLYPHILVLHIRILGLRIRIHTLTLHSSHFCGLRVSQCNTLHSVFIYVFVIQSSIREIDM